MADARLLIEAIRAPDQLPRLAAERWNDLIRMARSEALLGQVGARAAETGVLAALPPRVQTILADQAIAVAASQRTARWEAKRAMRALRPLGAPVVLLKGAAYVAADLPAAAGRTVGDLDILVPRTAIDTAETLLKAAGWAPLKSEPYDDAYYRRWMHELPPLAHTERGTVIDVHHTILPLTARRRPDAEALIAGARVVGDLHVLGDADMLLHSVAHAFYDGDFDGGLRNVWDIHRLIETFAAEASFWPRLAERAALHQLGEPLARALRVSCILFGTAVDPALAGRSGNFDRLVIARLLARDRWGRPARPLLRRAFYIRSHWLRMPPLLLARHLWTKWRMRRCG